MFFDLLDLSASVIGHSRCESRQRQCSQVNTLCAGEMSRPLTHEELDQYLARIGYAVSPHAVQPTLQSLQDIVRQHSLSLPFDNLSTFCQLGVPIDVDSIFAKIVLGEGGRRSGYCFEVNRLLQAALETVGFTTQAVPSRVRYRSKDRAEGSPVTHMLLRVRVQGEACEFLVDVGLGGLSPPTPLRLELDTVQTTSHEARRIQQAGDTYYHQVLLSEGWIDLSSFPVDAPPMPFVDQLVYNWYVCSCPEAWIRAHLVVCLATSGGSRLTLLDSAFTEKTCAGKVLRETRVHSRDELKRILDVEFGIDLPDAFNASSPFSKRWFDALQ